MTINSKIKPVILDMDPGVDDALAIILAVKSGLLDIKAITICGGNVSRDQCALNALKTLRKAGISPEPPVSRGAPDQLCLWQEWGLLPDRGTRQYLSSVECK